VLLGLPSSRGSRASTSAAVRGTARGAAGVGAGVGDGAGTGLGVGTGVGVGDGVGRTMRGVVDGGGIMPSGGPCTGAGAGVGSGVTLAPATTPPCSMAAVNISAEAPWRRAESRWVGFMITLVTSISSALQRRPPAGHFLPRDSGFARR